jgi:hypothetical protein
MDKSLAITVLLALCLPASAQGILPGILNVQSGVATYTFNSASSGIIDTCASAASTCTLSGLTAASNGDVVVLVVGAYKVSALTISSATGNSASLTKCPGSVCAGFGGTDYSTDEAVYLSSSSGGTSYTVTLSAATTSVAWTFAVLDFTPSTSVSYDIGNNKGISTGTSNPTAPTLSISGTSDLFIQAIYYSAGSGTISIGGGYTIPSGFKVNPSGARTFAVAYLTNQTSYTAPTWTIASGQGALSALAIQ